MKAIHSAFFGPLVVRGEGGLKRLIVIDAEDAAVERRALRNQTALLRGRNSARVCGRRSSRPGSRESTSVLTRPGDAVELRIVPGDGERDGGVQQRAEVVRVVGELPEIVGVHQEEFADGLLEAGIELIAESGLNGDGGRAEDILRKSAGAGGARKQQVLIERRFESAGVGGAQNGGGLLDVVGEAQPRLRAVVLGQAVVAVKAEAAR